MVFRTFGKRNGRPGGETRNACALLSDGFEKADHHADYEEYAHDAECDRKGNADTGINVKLNALESVTDDF